MSEHEEELTRLAIQLQIVAADAAAKKSAGATREDGLLDEADQSYFLIQDLLKKEVRTATVQKDGPKN